MVCENLQGMIRDEEGWMSIGPWGGEDGESWIDNADGRIMQITVCYGLAINSIIIESKSRDGVVEGSSKEFGSTCGYETKKFNIDTAEEQLSSISLTYDYFYGKLTIMSICFNTTLKKYGPFGWRKGVAFVSIPIKDVVLCGLYGGVRLYLFALGLSEAPNVLITSQSIQMPDQAPTKLKTPCKESEEVIHNGASNGTTTHEVDNHGTGARSFSSEMIHDDLQLVDSAFQNYKTNMDMQIKEACQKLEMLQRSGSKESDFEELGHDIGKLKQQILCATNKEDPQAGAAYPSSGVGSTPETWEIATIKSKRSSRIKRKKKSKRSSRFSLPNVKTHCCGFKPKTLDDRRGARSFSSEIIHKDLQLVDSAFQNYKIHMDMQINEAHEKLEMLQRSGSKESEFDELGKTIAKLMSQIPLGTNEDDQDLSPTSKLIRSDLILLGTALTEAASVLNVKEKIESADGKFKELSKKSSGSKSTKKDLRTEIAELKVKIRSHSKIRLAIAHKNWDNIKSSEDGTTKLFHKERVDQRINDSDVLTAFDELSVPRRHCLLCFFKFPPEASIKKTPMIYLWIGQGYISLPEDPNTYYGDVKLLANEIFDELIEKHLIKPIYQKCSLEPDSYKMEHLVRSSLYKKAELGGFTSKGNIDLDADSLPGNDLNGTVKKEENPSGKSCLVNVGEAIISCKPEIFKKHIQSLYLGRWQSLATHHIEVPDVKILHGLNKVNTLTFLSLQGISMITELPAFISELSKLMILDLRACHNLEMIPDNIGMLKSLTHLDMSECYFLEHMPKSLAQLSNLQVLKGFLIEDFKKKKKLCTLHDLLGLEMLRKLNIYIRVKDNRRLQDLKFLEGFQGLKKLTISWGGCTGIIKGTVYPDATLPPNLQKLDLQCVPMICLPNCLMPSKLKELKKLYITGGKICYLGQLGDPEWEPWKTVEVLKLKYLNELDLDWSELRGLFPDLICLRQVKCPRLTNFPCDGKGIWTNEKASDTHVQLKKYLEAAA